MITRRIGEGTGLLWAALVGTVVFEHVVVATSGGTSPWWWVALAVLTVTLALAVRRTRPHAALAVVGMLVVARLLWSSGHGVPFPISYVVALTVLSWLAGRRASATRDFVLLVAGANLLLLLLGILLRGDTGVAVVGLDWLFSLLSCLVLVVLPWLMGRHRRQRALLATAGWERAEQMEHEQQLLVQRARLRERTRIARDMHDSLGHELSLIALRAGALEVAPDLTEDHRRAAGELREAAATATDRLATIVGVLREDGVPASLTPSGEGVVELVERAAESGMQVHLMTNGDLTGTPETVQRVAHRVVREGLTNATKHAPGAPVTVRMGTTGDGSTVSVTNALLQEPRGDAGSGGGHGLRDLGELLELVGGTLRSGGGEGGDHELVAHIPHEVGTRSVGTDGPAEGSTASAAARDSARRRARRGLLVAVVAPLAMGAAVGALILGYYVGISYASILDPDDYRDLRVGETRAGMEEVLPALEMVEAPDDRGSTPPAGSTCEFYRPDRPFSISFAYRLCFDDGVLVSKDTVPTGSVTPGEENP